MLAFGALLCKSIAAPARIRARFRRFHVGDAGKVVSLAEFPVPCAPWVCAKLQQDSLPINPLWCSGLLKDDDTFSRRHASEFTHLLRAVSAKANG